MLDTENLVILSGRAIMDEALIFAIEHGIIDVAELQAQVEEMRKTEYLKNHDQAIWESGGYWFTHVKTSRGRKLLKRKTRESLDELIIATYKDMVVDPTVEECYAQWSMVKLCHEEMLIEMLPKGKNHLNQL